MQDCPPFSPFDAGLTAKFQAGMKSSCRYRPVLGSRKRTNRGLSPPPIGILIPLHMKSASGSMLSGIDMIGMLPGGMLSPGVLPES